MRFLKSIWAIITARWFLTLLGAVILSLLVWFYGELLRFGDAQPFGSDVAKLVAILVVAFIWGLSNLYAQRKAQQNNVQLVAELSAPVQSSDPATEEIDEIGGRFQEALGQLKKRRFRRKRGKGYLYELPWYIVIGPPGSGKTTAIERSGLRFPLARGVQDTEFRGVGGTRNCDWFFTDEAVLIDTAGRYTTQDSRREVDHAAWLGFLDLLKKHRPRRPINGVVVAISVEDIARGGTQRGIDHARAVRNRLLELSERLGVLLPVYVVFTKADLIAGFVDFFKDLDEDARQQVWGMTFPFEPHHPEGEALGQFGSAYDRLLERLQERVFDRLHTARDVGARSAIFNFPAQMAALKRDLQSFLSATFYQSDYEAPPLVRGVYFTSGVQHGLPIDRMKNAVAAAFGLERVAPAEARGERSYFLTRLLRDVVLAEANLAGFDPKHETRLRLLRGAAYAGAGVAVLGLTFGWTFSYIGNRDRALAVEDALAAYAKEAQPVAKTRLEPQDRDLLPILPALDRLRSLPAGYEARKDGDSLLMRLGLSQRGAFSEYGETAYRRGLERLFLPRLIVGEEEDLRARINDPDYVLPALKVYLMLGGQTEPDDELIRTWLNEAWRQLYPRRDAERAQLGEHLEALLSFNLDARPPLDGDLIARARDTLTEVSVAKRAYTDFLASPAVRELPPWRPAEHAGPEARSVLVRHSGRDLNAGVPGIFTHRGFHELFLPVLPDIAKAAAVESWVLGEENEVEMSEAELERLEADILKLYYDDFIERWEELLLDVTLAPLGDLSDSVDALNTLSGPNSPIKLLLQAVVEETKLATLPEEPSEGAGQDAGGALKMAGRVLGKYGSMLKKGAKVVSRVGGAGAAAAAAAPGQPVEDHFAYLHEMVEGVDGAPPALDNAIQALGKVHADLQQFKLAPNADEAFLRGGARDLSAAELAEAAQDLPKPLHGWLGGVAETATSLSSEAIRRQLNAIWRADVLPFCHAALDGRFPFNLSSPVDVSVEDFARLFAPGGLIDAYFEEHLKPFVDTARRPWRWQQQLGISAGVLAQFERARRIRDGLFAGGPQPQARFTLKPVGLDARSRRVLLDLDGQVVTYDHGPTLAQPLQWPGPDGTNLVRIAFSPIAPQATPVVISEEGSWSWFRLLHRADFERTDLPDVFRITLAASGHSVVYELRAASVENPFDLEAFANFRCPEGL